MSLEVLKRKFVVYAASRMRVHEYTSWKQNQDLLNNTFAFRFRDFTDFSKHAIKSVRCVFKLPKIGSCKWAT